MDVKVLLIVGSLVLSGVLGLVVWAYEMWVKRKAKTDHPLDESLRSRVASDRTWENCAFQPDFAEAVLERFAFLVEDYGFDRPRLRPRKSTFQYRRDDLGVEVQDEGDNLSVLSVDLVLYKSPKSFLVLVRHDLNEASGKASTDSLTRFMRNDLDEEVAKVREVAS